MIPHFSDHAANERTYLAWVRTALAVVALGFLLERFDIFLSALHQAAEHVTAPHHLRTTEWIGLILIAFGIAVIFFATVRFALQRKDIYSTQTIHYRNSYGELVLAGMLILVGLIMLFYVANELLALS